MPPPLPPPRAKAPPVPALVKTPPVPDPGRVSAAGRPGAVTAGRVPDRPSDIQLSRVLQAQFLVGNAAVAAALLGVPPGGYAPGDAGLAGQFPGGAGRGLMAGQALLTGQGMVGNGAVGPGPAGPGAAGLGPGATGPGVGGATPGAALETVPGAPAAAAGGAPAEVAGSGPAVAVRPGPANDPKFAALKKDVHAKKRAVASSHPPPRSEAVSAQAAARPPADDKEAQGKTANADKMDAAQPKDFDKAAFIKAVEEAIAKKAPKNLEEADEFGDSDKPKQVKQDVQQQVGAGKEASASEIASTTAAPPDTSNVKDKQVVPLTADKPPPTPGTPDPGNAIPDKLPASATDLSAGPKQVNAQLADAQVTEAQLAHSNEPQFTNALDQKHAVEQESVQAQGTMRVHETKTLTAAKTDAGHLGGAAMHAIAGKRVTTGKQVGAGKSGAKDSDEAKRAQVTAILQRVFDATKKDVEDILSGLDKKVDDQFSREEKQARDTFTAEHKRKMAEYKDRRYSGPLGLLRWGKDKLLGLPAEADLIFVQARDHYVAQMRRVISDVADTIAAELGRAKARIAKGSTDLQAEVKRLPADLQTIGKQAAADFTDKFDELAQSVDDKGTELVDTLATKYTDALKSVDAEITAEKEKNKGLVDKVVDAVKGVIKTIIELKNLLLGVLAKAAQAVMMILKDPIGFLRNLVAGVGAGLKQFMKNIGKHLQQGLVTWLLGTAAKAGIQLPSSFDVKGILLLIASLLGLTWAAIRARIVRKVPEQAVTAAESAVPLAAKVKREGVAGMWDDLRSQVGDLKATLISKVTEYLVPTVIVAGIMWVLSLLNPASAFVRACKLIIDIVRFIVERGRQVLEFVNAVLDAVIAIAKGSGGGVPALIENALARAIPVLIGFLAAVLGIGGIADKVKKIFDTLSKPVMKAIDWVIDKIVGLVKKLWAKLKAEIDKMKKPKRPRKPERPDRDRAKDPRRPRRSKKDPRRPRRPEKDPHKPRAKRSEDREDRPRPDEKERRALAAALREARALVRPGASIQEIREALPEIRHRHRLTSLRLVIDGMTAATIVLHFEAVINPSERGPRDELTLTRQEIQESYGILVAHQARFQELADLRGLVIDIRATNPESAPWIEAGAIPKPTQVKAKTIQYEDTLIGVHRAKLGLVGFFEPNEPVRGSRDYAAANERYTARTKEYEKYYDAMQKLRPPPKRRGRFVVLNQVVYGYTDSGVLLPLAGDNDLFQIRYLEDDTLVSGSPYRRLINEMMKANIGVQHGATVNWHPKEGLVEVKIEVIRKAATEKIIRFRPHLPARLVTSTTPIEPVDRA
jgi:hypothetical protein